MPLDCQLFSVCNNQSSLSLSTFCLCPCAPFMCMCGAAHILVFMGILCVCMCVCLCVCVFMCLIVMFYPLKEHSVALRTIAPFIINYRTLSTAFKEIECASVNEPFLLVSEVLCVSPWQLVILESSFSQVCVRCMYVRHSLRCGM